MEVIPSVADESISSLANAIRQYPWYQAPDADVDCSVFSMLSIHERKMLAWLARHLPFGDACIVDAGCFLGGSTVALCHGLAGNPVADKSGKIVVYDMFVAPRNKYSLDAIGNGRTPGETVLDLFEANVATWRPFLDVRVGDFGEHAAPRDRIGLCFIDIAKTCDLNDHVVRTLFPRLIPGRSILIQQDYNDHSCPWVNVTMSRFAGHFEHLADVLSSRVYLYGSSIPPERLATPLRTEHSPESLLGLMDREIETCGNDVSRFFNQCSKAWLLFEFHGAEAAIAHLHSISPDQPWASSVPYANLVIEAIRVLRTADGLERHHRDYFHRL